VDFGTASIVRDQIINVVSNYEPRVTDVEVQVDPRPDTNEFEVTVIFNIIGQEVPTQQFSFILEATR
jgi:predicted component of type VI protein secretion system